MYLVKGILHLLIISFEVMHVQLGLRWGRCNVQRYLKLYLQCLVTVGGAGCANSIIQMWPGRP
jgi:hypothetical protein